MTYTIENNGIRIHSDVLFNPHCRRQNGEHVIMKVEEKDILELS